MTCTVGQRDRVREAAAAIEPHPAVLAVDWLAPETDPTNAWTLEVLLDAGTRGVPSDVARTLADHDLAIRAVAPQHPYRHVVAIAE